MKASGINKLNSIANYLQDGIRHNPSSSKSVTNINLSELNRDLKFQNNSQVKFQPKSKLAYHMFGKTRHLSKNCNYY